MYYKKNAETIICDFERNRIHLTMASKQRFQFNAKKQQKPIKGHKDERNTHPKFLTIKISLPLGTVLNNPPLVQHVVQFLQFSFSDICKVLDLVKEKN